MEQGQLYNLLPDILREKDQLEGGYALESLMTVLGTQLNEVESGIDQLYDNWFPQTCDSTLLPFLGDLLGLQINANSNLANLRREVINSIRYRRRKGIPWALAQLAENICGWPCRIVPQYTLLSRTQNIQTLDFDQGRLANTNDSTLMGAIDSPFNQTAHTADISSIGRNNNQGTSQLGKFGINKVTVYCWPVQIQVAESMSASRRHNPLCFCFSPLGNDVPLYNIPLAGDNTHLSPIQQQVQEQQGQNQFGQLSPHNLPTALDNEYVNKDLMAVSDNAVQSLYYGKERSFYIRYKLKGEPSFKEIPPSEIIATDLSSWTFPTFQASKNIKVAVDVVLGRICFRPSDIDNAKELEVNTNYHYGQSLKIGGGSYNRANSLVDASKRGFHVQVSQQNSFILETTAELYPSTYEVTLIKQNNCFKLEMTANQLVAPILSYSKLNLDNVVTTLALPPQFKAVYLPEKFPNKTVSITRNYLESSQSIKICPPGTFQELIDSTDETRDTLLKNNLVFELQENAAAGHYKISISKNINKISTLNSFDLSIRYAKSAEHLNNAIPYVIENLPNMVAIQSSVNNDRKLQDCLSLVHIPAYWDINDEQSLSTTSPTSTTPLVLLEAGEYALWPRTLRYFYSNSIILELLQKPTIGLYKVSLSPNLQKFDSQRTFDVKITFTKDSTKIATAPERVYQHLTPATLNKALSQAPLLTVSTLPYDMEIPREQSFIFSIEDKPSNSDQDKGIQNKDIQSGIIITMSSYVTNISDALGLWKNNCQASINSTQHNTNSKFDTNRHGLIEVMDSSVYQETLADILVDQGFDLAIEASNGARPVIACSHQEALGSPINVQVRGFKYGTLQFNGIHFFGDFNLNINTRISFSHCSGYRFASPSKEIRGNTLVPSTLKVSNQSEQAEIALSACIFGPLEIPSTSVYGLAISDSIIQSGTSNYAITGRTRKPHNGEPPNALCNDKNYTCATYINRSTILGTCFFSELYTSNSLFNETVSVQNQQIGFCRYSYCPPNSKTPVKFRCQQGDDNADTKILHAPIFVSSHYSDAGFARLSQVCPGEIVQGGEEERQIGVFHHFQSPNILDKLKHTIEDNLPVGLEANIFLVD